MKVNMNKTKVNYWVDVFLAVSLLICFFTGLLKWSGASRIIGIQIFRSLFLRELSNLHDISGLVLGILVFLHIILHMDWIVAMTKRIFKKN